MKITHNNVRMTSKRKSVMLCAKFAAKKLGVINANVTVNVVFTHDLLKTFNVHAEVHQVNARRINILFDAKVDACHGLGTIAHEMVHVKQFIKKELSHDKKGNLTWKGKKVPADLAYCFRPWEREAMRKESIIQYEYTHSRGDIVK